MALPDEFTASRLEMAQRGVPDDYIDTLLDGDYMSQLVRATDALHEKRRRKYGRYLLLNKLILGFLTFQAVLGLLLTLWKFISPDVSFRSTPVIENMDMVIMLDASGHMFAHKDHQHQAVGNFTGELKAAMFEKRNHVVEYTQKEMVNARKSLGRSKRLRVPFISDWLDEQFAKRDKIFVKGANLRTSVGLYNTDKSRILVGLDDGHHEQDAKFGALGGNDYVENARFMDAMEQCRKEAMKAGKGTTVRYCVIIGDNDAMCAKRHLPKVTELCKKFPQLCPPESETEKHGSLFEWSDELSQCSDFAVKELAANNMSVIMLFTTGSDDEAQRRLSVPSFRSFVTTVTGCGFETASVQETTKDGYQVVRTYNNVKEGCHRFMLVDDYEMLMRKSKELAHLLRADAPVVVTLEEKTDRIWWLFLFLPLNLLFYVAWTKCILCFTKIQTQMQTVVGAKKKMVKVTRKLVEKEFKPKKRRNDLQVKFSELEMAEMAVSRPAVTLGQHVTLRARLKGGFLRRGLIHPGIDGDGNGFSPEAFWKLEPLDAAGSGKADCFVSTGRRVVIRGSDGFLLAASAEGVTRTSDEADPACEFVVYPVNEDYDKKSGGVHHLGDTVRLWCASTNQFLRVRKDGNIDATGVASSLETQFQIDAGGDPLMSGAVVCLTAEATGELVRIVDAASGEVNALRGGGSLNHWLLERRKGDTRNSVAFSSRASTSSEAFEAGAPFRHGDLVSLRCINQNLLGVHGDDRKVHCGDGVALTQEFVMERFGMASNMKMDDTIRAGGRVLLRPLVVNNSEEPSRDYLRAVASTGTLQADGHLTGKDAVFCVKVASVQEMLSHLKAEIVEGDATLTWKDVWDKRIGKANCLTAAWTSKEDGGQFTGAVVHIEADGSCNVPKQVGAAKGWVAVVKDGLDLRKAAQLAKGKGATGLIVRCRDGHSIKHIVASTKGVEAPPELPTIFLDAEAGIFLDKRGVTLEGMQLRNAKLTTALRSVGESVARGFAAEDDEARMFKDLGVALIDLEAKNKEREQQRSRGSQLGMAPAAKDDESKYSWKVTSNTCYLWNTQKLQVDYGAKAPPSALKRTKIDTETGEEVGEIANDPWVSPRRGESKPAESTAFLDSDDVMNHRLGEELSEVLTSAHATALAREELPADSDFKITYEFEEVEVAVGADVGELEDFELLQEEGHSFVRQLAVPYKYFHMVVTGLIVSTMALILAMVWALRRHLASEDVEELAASVQVPLSGFVDHSALTGFLENSKSMVSW